MKLKLTLEVEVELDATLSKEEAEKRAMYALRRAMHRADEKMMCEYRLAYAATMPLAPATLHVDGDARGKLEIKEHFH